MSTPERTHNGHGNAAPRLPDGPITPPQNLEAEQSVLGAVLLSDTALPALIIDERPASRRTSTARRTGSSSRRCSSSTTAASRSTRSRWSSTSSRPGSSRQAGGRSAIDLLASSVPAVGHVRQYARIVRENAMLRRLLRAAYDIQARVHSHDAPPRELVDIAERSILEVAHEDSRKDFRAINDVLYVEIDKLEQLSAGGQGDHRHRRRASRTSTPSPAASSPAT